MKRPRVLLDVDGVLADFLEASLTVIKNLSGKTYTIDDFKTWDLFETVPRAFEQPFYDAVNRPGWCRALQVYPGAIEGVRALRQVSDLYVVTSPLNHVPTWTHEREAWLHEHFGIPHKQVVHTSAKYLCLGDLLIDDRPANIEKWEAEHPNGRGLLWDQPYNHGSNAGIRVKDWNDVQKFVEYERRGNLA